MRMFELARVVVAVGLILFSQACSPGFASPRHLAETGAVRFGPGEEYVIFSVPSEGREDDEEFFRNSRLYGGSDLSQRLAQLFARAEGREMRIVVGGPSSSKSRYVVLQALKLNKGRSLGGLVLLFVGEKADAAVVQQAAYPYLATVYFDADT